MISERPYNEVWTVTFQRGNILKEMVLTLFCLIIMYYSWLPQEGLCKF